MAGRPPRRAAWLINLAVSLLAVIVLLAAAEGALRLFYPPPALARNYRLPDPILGWRLEPGAQTRLRRPEYVVSVQINADGWRDVPHTPDPTPDAFRILVLGDSYMEAYMIDLEESFPRRLEALAHAAGLPQVEVINLGVGGYGTLQEYLAFVEYGLRYRPDLVLLAFYADNDVHNNSAALSLALWGPEDPNYYSRPFLLPGPVEEWDIQPPDYARAVAEAQRRADRPWWQQTALAAFLQTAARAAEEGGSGGPELWSGAFLCDPPPAYAEGWALTRRILARLNETAAGAGAHLVVFTVPSRAEVSPVYRDRVLARAADPAAFCFEESAGSAGLLSIAGAEGIPAVDLLPAFREALLQEGIDPFYRQDRHWNPDGHALAAQTVFAALRERSLLPPAP